MNVSFIWSNKERWNGCCSRSTYFFTSLCTCVLSDHRIFQKIMPVALSHCLTGTEGDTVYVITLKTSESTTKFRKVPETTGKPESQESVSVALSHFFVNRRFQFSETQNASDIISFYPSLNKSAYIWENRKAVNTLFNVSTAFFMRFFYFKNTHIQLVEARGIEPLSESSFMQLSTSVFYLLWFPVITADKRAEKTGSPYTIDGHGHFRQSFTAHRCPSESRGTPSVDRSWLKQLPVRYF